AKFRSSMSVLISGPISWANMQLPQAILNPAADEIPSKPTVNIAGILLHVEFDSARALRRLSPARKMAQKAYAKAGVDIDLGNKVKATLPELLASTHRAEVLGKVGGFGGLFALNTKKYKQPVLVSSVDGVGTKLKIAFTMGKHDTVGQDLVNHCVN